MFKPLATYSRIEVLIPAYYTIGKKIYEFDQYIIEEFLNDTVNKYDGVTHTSPFTSPPYRGLWQPPIQDKKGDLLPIVTDYLWHLFCLVRLDETSDAIAYFLQWKPKLEKKLHQDVILMYCYQVQVLGGFLSRRIKE